MQNIVAQLKNDRLSQIILILLIPLSCAVCGFFGYNFLVPTQESITGQEREYAENLSMALQDFTLAIGIFNDLIENVDAGNPEWEARVKEQIEAIQNAYNTLQKIIPPPKFESVHSEIIQTLEDCHISMNHYLVGFENTDPDELELGNEFMNSCYSKIEVLAEKVELITE